MMEIELDWTGCELVEMKPGKGRPIVRGTRGVLADDVLNRYDLGESHEEIRKGLSGLTSATVRRLIEFANSRRGQLR